ncbi:MAG TPA: FtsX-like permease family protein, partial [Thermoanaerobaculia bacterium]|nr:FtsX-like permease family protein [Thermoanaerobaculia bacterium]
ARTGLPRAAEVRIEATVVAFTLGIVALIAAGVSTLVVVWSARADTLALRDRTATAGSARARGLLVAAQVAIAVTLVASGALLLQSYRRLRAVETGFDPDGVLAFRVALPRTTYDTSAKQRAFFEQLQAKLSTTPGVTSVSAVSELPFGVEAWTMTFDVAGRTIPAGGETPSANTRLVLPGYTETMRIPLLRGRTLTARDSGDPPRAVVIDITAARRWWPNEDPIGKRITFSGNVPEPIWREVVGIVGAVRHDTLSAPAEPHIYMPLLQSGASQMYVVVRGRGDLTRDVRAVVRSLDPMQPVHGMKTMRQYVDDATAQPRLRATLVAIFAAIGVLLASVGLYALLAFIVASRTREVGVRIALGATPAQVVRFVVRWSLRVTAAGLAAGLLGAIAMTRAMRALLFGVDPLDPATYVLVAASFLILAVTASAVPAFRAARIDPAAALRQE